VTPRAGKNVGRVWIYVGALLLAAWTIIPLYWMLMMAFDFRSDFIAQPTAFIPRHVTLFNFDMVLNRPARYLDGKIYPPSGHAPAVIRGFKNSMTVAVVTAIVTLLVSVPVAYALGRLRFGLKNTFLFTILASRSLPAIAVLIPFYNLFQRTELLGSLRGLMIVDLSITVPLAVWLLTGFFASLPRTVEREARVDGCTRFGSLWRVILPMSRAGIAAAGSMAFLASWNEFTYAFVLTSGTNAQTLPPTLAGMFLAAWGEPTQLAAAATLSILPPLALAYVFQSQMRRLAIVEAL
jgi:multiple sugar transport system permease protein